MQLPDGLSFYDNFFFFGGGGGVVETLGGAVELVSKTKLKNILYSSKIKCFLIFLSIFST